MQEITLKEASKLVSRGTHHLRRLLVANKIQGRKIGEASAGTERWLVDKKSLFNYFMPNIPQSRSEELRPLREETKKLLQAVEALEKRVRALQ